MASYIQRRNRGPALIPQRWRRHYNVWYDDGFGFSVSLNGLNILLGGRRQPEEFWACIEAADEAFKSGDVDAVFEWPTGTRLASAPRAASN